MNKVDRSHQIKERVRVEYKYTKSVVVFLDILGFKNLVQNPDNNTTFALIFETIGKLNSLDLPKMRLKGMKITSISDSIVISVPYKEKASFEKIVRMLFVIERLLIREEILLRGAISIGDLYHENGSVFGPALVDAYLLENDCAIYPRCIIKKDTFQEGLKTCKSIFGKEQVAENFREDFDGFLFYDYLSDEFNLRMYEDKEFEKPWQLYEEMREIKLLIESYLEEKQFPDKVTMKYEWLKRYYNSVILEFNEKENVNCKEFIIN